MMKKFCAYGFGLCLVVGCGDDESKSGVDAAPSSDAPTADAAPMGFQAWKLDDLKGGTGFSLRTPELDVEAGTEVQTCYFVDTPDINGDGKDFWIDKIVTAINPGSHHVNVFRVNTIKMLKPEDGTPTMLGDLPATVISDGECFKGPNWSDWPIVANSQNSKASDPYTTWQLPSGVAHRFTPGQKLMLQVHYVNAATQETPYKGKVGVNFHKSAATNPLELGTLFATQQSIRICQSDPTPSYKGTCKFGGKDLHIAAANGHFHSVGKQFDVFTWDGTSTTQPPDSDRFYQSEDWSEPPMLTGLDVNVPENGGVWWSCDCQWHEPSVGCDAVNMADKQMQNDCCYTFGPKVELNEHCNVFVYYWPKVSDVTCN